MTNSELFTAAHKLAKTFEGDYKACFVLALAEIRTKKTIKMNNKISYTINDAKNGMFATVSLPEGTFNLTLTYKRGMNNKREWTINGNYPKDTYSISYEAGNLFILKKGGEYKEGQKLTHKAFGKGVVTSVNGNMVTINFDKVGEKSMMKSILKNFLK